MLKLVSGANTYHLGNYEPQASGSAVSSLRQEVLLLDLPRQHITSSNAGAAIGQADTCVLREL